MVQCVVQCTVQQCTVQCMVQCTVRPWRASPDLQRRVHRRVVVGDRAGVEGDGAYELVVAFGQPRVRRRLVDGEGVEGEGGVRACRGSWAWYVHGRGVAYARGGVDDDAPCTCPCHAHAMPMLCPCHAHAVSMPCIAACPYTMHMHMRAVDSEDLAAVQQVRFCL